MLKSSLHLCQPYSSDIQPDQEPRVPTTNSQHLPQLTLTTLSLHIAYHLLNKLLLSFPTSCDRKLNALILQLTEKQNLVAQGKWGLVGLANLAEDLAGEHRVIDGMLKGKPERVMAVTDLSVFQN